MFRQPDAEACRRRLQKSRRSADYHSLLLTAGRQKIVNAIWCDSGCAVLSDDDLILGWAAEEFLAAGRAPQPDERRLHRRHAEFFTDLFRELNRIPDRKPREGDPENLGQLLAKAFTAPPAPKGRRRRLQASSLRPLR